MDYFVVFRIPIIFWKAIATDTGVSKWLFAFVAIALPALVAWIVFTQSICISEESYSFLVSAFSIFSAFLFAAQISAFSIYKATLSAMDEKLKGLKSPDDAILNVTLDTQLDDASNSLSNGYKIVNCTISYLVFISVMLLISIIGLSVFDLTSVEIAIVLSVSITHFFVVLLFSIGQSYEVFANGYEADV